HSDRTIHHGLTLSLGQRTDVIVEANGGPSEAYSMRSNSQTIVATVTTRMDMFIICNESADTSALPLARGYFLPETPDNNGYTNDDLMLTVPSCAMALQGYRYNLHSFMNI